MYFFRFSKIECQFCYGFAHCQTLFDYFLSIVLLYLSLIEIAVRFLAIFIRNLGLWDEDAPQKSFRAPKYQIGEKNDMNLLNFP